MWLLEGSTVIPKFLCARVFKLVRLLVWRESYAVICVNGREV